MYNINLEGYLCKVSAAGEDVTKNLYISQAGFIVGIFADGTECATGFPLNYLSECKTKIIMKQPLSTAMLNAAMEAD